MVHRRIEIAYEDERRRIDAILVLMIFAGVASLGLGS
jgi:hypothetical protein